MHKSNKLLFDFSSLDDSFEYISDGDEEQDEGEVKKKFLDVSNKNNIN